MRLELEATNKNVRGGGERVEILDIMQISVQIGLNWNCPAGTELGNKAGSFWTHPVVCSNFRIPSSTNITLTNKQLKHETL